MGAGQVIKGWEVGLQGMCLNEKRTITIPADMAYGEFVVELLSRRIRQTAQRSPRTGPRGFGSVIPANSALVFDVELVGLESKAPASHEEL